MKPPFKQRHPLFRPLAAMTASILCLFILSYFLVITSSDKLNLNASILKIASSQRSLSQEMTNSIAADNLEGEISGLPLDSLMNIFKQQQNILLRGNSDLNIQPLKRQFLSDYHNLDVVYTGFVKQLNRNLSSDSTGFFVDLLNAENTYLKELDNFTGKLSGYSNKEVENFRLKEVIILCISLMLVFMEIRLIFMPAITKIERQNIALREISFTQSHIVRKPLANIKGLITLTLDAKNQDPYSVQLLQLAKKEADELDAAIKNNIYKSDVNHRLDI